MITDLFVPLSPTGKDYSVECHCLSYIVMWQVVGVLFLSPTAHTHTHTRTHTHTHTQPLQVVEVLFLSPTTHARTHTASCWSTFSFSYSTHTHTHTHTQHMHALPWSSTVAECSSSQGNRSLGSALSCSSPCSQVSSESQASVAFIWVKRICIYVYVLKGRSYFRKHFSTSSHPTRKNEDRASACLRGLP